ncbi:HD domain-containing phosphohydrolase [Oleiagrimonas soli]|uniref:Putative two-component system response regulator n=1 Tax=Oleiagrimonas soli TaxID=1543381 RepID=A0A841KJ46_9GAMM|nr:HD domain-containing phosphohydrolase [Oleiagrimonas soli]MBB6183987.1 putative two-component system response regulator [Oleiagrimonas soli]
MANESILIVDDEPQNLAVLQQILDDDYLLVFARSGTEALEAARKHAPDLVLMDVQMPNMDGYTACRQLKADPATVSIPVIFVTTLSDIGNETAGFQAGAVDYIIKPISSAVVRARVHTHLSLVQATLLERSYHDAIHMLGEAGHYNDLDTGVHIWRMAAYSAALAEAAGWGPQRRRLLELAAPMHDTGKIGIPDSILRKPGPLDADEWKVMRTHTRIGHDILAKSDAPVFRLAAEIALRHHEWWDGSGYPDGLAERAIPESARIVAIADTFDALTMDRPYKQAWPVGQAMARLRQDAGSHFEPRLVRIFDNILPLILDIKSSWDARDRITAQPIGPQYAHLRRLVAPMAS